MGSSLYAGVSGLNASSKQLDVIGNNIANVNSIGFKAGKIYFSDILSKSMTGGASDLMQVGRGVQVSSVRTEFASGSFETTANATDLSIDGDGFFMVNDNDGSTFFTRAGAFQIDNAGYLVDVNGFKVQGTLGTEQITDISLSDAKSDPVTTTEFSIGANFNAATATGDVFNVPQTVYDSLGAQHILKMTFQKTEGNGMWGVESFLKLPDENGDLVDAPATAQDNYGIKFDTSGALEKIYTGTAGTPTSPVNTSNGTVAVAINEGDTGLDAAGGFTITRGADANTWVIDGVGADYANVGITSEGVADTDDSLVIDYDTTDGEDTNITLTLGSTWYTGDVITVTTTNATTVTSATTPATMNGAATAVVDRPGQIPHTGTLLLTRGDDAATWTITDTGGYASPTVISADATTVEICLDGSSTTVADVTLTLSGTWVGGNTLKVPLVGCVAGTGLVTPTDTTDTVTAVLNNPEKFVAGANALELTRAATGTSPLWSVTVPGVYTSAAVLSSSDTAITIALDGGTEADITLALTGTYVVDDTLDFSLVAGNGTTPADITTTLPAIDGATIGVSGVVTWDVFGLTAKTMTGYSSTSVVTSLICDGYASGTLKSISVLPDGVISGFFTNGQTSSIGELQLADFGNPWGLKREGNNLFSKTVTSGDPITSAPGTSGLGDITPNSLEMSNTDIATEFINMITAQRAYQANAKVITTTDQMMSELMNIKR